MKLPIYLIGFMASGKSSMGKQLAKKMGLSFIDLDKEIEKHEGLSVSQLFEQEGEAYFRSKESELLQNTLLNNSQVIALGGGTVCHSNNMEWVNQNGFSVYLKKSNTRLLGRLRQNKSKRPLVAQLNDEELKLFIEKKMEEREPFYRQAHLVFESDDKSLNDLIKQLKTVNS